MADKDKSQIATKRLILLALIMSLTTGIALGQRRHAAVLDWGEFQSIGKVPAEFGPNVIFGISKITVPQRGPLVTRRLSGTLYPSEVIESKLVGARVRGRQLTFGTQVVRGVSYSFSGKFTEDFATDEHGNPNDVILEGVLIRFVKGKEVARATISFRFQNYSD